MLSEEKKVSDFTRFRFEMIGFGYADYLEICQKVSVTNLEANDGNKSIKSRGNKGCYVREVIQKVSWTLFPNNRKADKQVFLLIFVYVVHLII